jgi:hypothetical protein
VAERSHGREDALEQQRDQAREQLVDALQIDEIRYAEDCGWTLCNPVDAEEAFALLDWVQADLVDFSETRKAVRVIANSLPPGEREKFWAMNRAPWRVYDPRRLIEMRRSLPTRVARGRRPCCRPRQRRQQRHVARSTSSADPGDDEPDLDHLGCIRARKVLRKRTISRRDGACIPVARSS